MDFLCCFFSVFFKLIVCVRDILKQAVYSLISIVFPFTTLFMILQKPQNRREIIRNHYV